MRKIFIVGFMLLGFTVVQVGIGTRKLVSNAISHLGTKEKGLLFTRMSVEERDTIISHPEGLTLYNTTSHSLEFWDGGRWVCAGNTQDTKRPSTLGLRCETASVEGLFLKGVKSFGKITLKAYYNEINENTIDLSNPIFVEGVEGLKAQSNPKTIMIRGGENVLTYDVKGIPGSEGNSKFKITVLDQSCTVKIPIKETVSM